MSTQLIQILAFEDVANGGVATLPHNINVNGRRFIPDLIGLDTAGFEITGATDEEIEVTNNTGAEASCNVYLRFDHTVQRWFGAKQDGELVPQPFVLSPGGASGVGATPAVIFDDAVPANEVNIRSDRATNQSPINNARVGITDLSSKTGGASTGATHNYATISGGDQNSASDEYATVGGGFRNTASGSGASVPGGFSNIASGDASFATGDTTVASGTNAHAEGRTTLAQGDNSHAEGISTQATAINSHAEGNSSVASNAAAHAEGTGTTASGANAHAEGNGSQATAAAAHAEGGTTVASGQFSHAEGDSTTASGYASHAEGGSNTASGDFASASGVRSVAVNDGEHAHASGRIAVNGDAQTRLLVLRIANLVAPFAATPLVFGESGDLDITLVDNRAYTVTVTAVAGGGAGGAVSAAIERQFIIRTTGGAMSIIASGIQSIIGHATAVANWEIAASAPGGLALRITFSSGADAATANVSATARVQLECCVTVP